MAQVLTCGLASTVHTFTLKLRNFISRCTA
jgi:hypothetical protein